MLANWVKETTTTTGTGSISLGGAVAGYIAFSDAFRDGDAAYYAIEDGNNREIGIGTLTAGTHWTLARTTVLETLDNGVFTRGSATAISLSGSAVVMVSMNNHSNATGQCKLTQIVLNQPTRLQSAHEVAGNNGGTTIAYAGKQYLTPYRLDIPVKITALLGTITVAAPGAVARIGMCTLTDGVLPATTLFDEPFDTSVSSSLPQVISVTPTILMPGWYGMLFLSDTDLTVRSRNTTLWSPINCADKARPAPGTIIYKSGCDPSAGLTPPNLMDNVDYADNNKPNLHIEVEWLW